jgi:PAS domain S-box-containing protein
MRQAAEAVLVLDAGARIAYLNPAFYRLFGYAPEEILGKPIVSLSVPGDDAALQPAAVVAALREHGQWKGEVRRRARDGTAIPVLLSASVIRDDKGDIAGYVGTFLDLRQIKRAEQALAESEEKFRSISATALDAVLMLDDDGRIAYWNPAASRIFGHAAAEALGQEAHVFLAPRRYHDAYRKGWSAFSESGRGPVIGKFLELVALRKDGTEFPIELSISALKLNDRWHAVGILRDITARKQAEEALRRSNRALKTLSAGNAALVHAQSESDLLRQICRAVVETGGYAYAWIGYAANDAERRIRPMAQEGFEPGFLEALPSSAQGQDPCSTAVREGAAVVARAADNDPALAERRDPIARLGIGSLASFPLLRGAEAFGMLSIYSRERDAFDRDGLMLLAEMAEDLNFGSSRCAPAPNTSGSGRSTSRPRSV